MSDNLNHLLFAFNEHMKVKNYAKATVAEYSRELQKFIDHLRETGITDIKHVTKDVLMSFQAGLMEFKAKGEEGIQPFHRSRQNTGRKAFFRVP